MLSYLTKDLSNAPRICGATSYRVILANFARVGWCFRISVCRRSCSSAENSTPVGPPPRKLYEQSSCEKVTSEATYPQYKNAADSYVASLLGMADSLARSLKVNILAFI